VEGFVDTFLGSRNLRKFGEGEESSLKKFRNEDLSLKSFSSGLRKVI